MYKDTIAVDYLRHNRYVLAEFRIEDAVMDKPMSHDHYRRHINVPDYASRQRIELGLYESLDATVVEEILFDLNARDWRFSFSITKDDRGKNPVEPVIGASVFVSIILGLIVFYYTQWFELSIGLVVGFFIITALALTHFERKKKEHIKTQRNAQLARLHSSTEQIIEENMPASNNQNRDVFIVHGHDEAAKHEVARFIDKLGLRPIILHEQASGGSKTVIEKFEHFSDVSFAVILLTPDDTGAPASQPTKTRLRARQNVILELGYFMGKLGREKVYALYKSDVELPSDYAGVLYILMDVKGAWKQDLAREIKQAGIHIDINKGFF